MKYRKKYYWEDPTFFFNNNFRQLKKLLDLEDELFLLKFPKNFDQIINNEKLRKKMLNYSFIWGIFVFYDFKIVKIYLGNLVFDLKFSEARIERILFKLAKKHSFLLFLGSVSTILNFTR